MTSCRDLELLIAERAAGDLSLQDQARLDAHLPTCEHCRAELAACEEVLDLARVGEPRHAPVPAGLTAARTLGPDLGRAVLLNLRRRRRTWRISFAGGLSMAVAALVVVVVSSHPGHSAGTTVPAATDIATASWEPDVEGALEASALGDVDSQDDLGSGDTELAALEASDLP